MNKIYCAIIELAVLRSKMDMDECRKGIHSLLFGIVLEAKGTCGCQAKQAAENLGSPICHG